MNNQHLYEEYQALNNLLNAAKATHLCPHLKTRFEPTLPSISFKLRLKEARLDNLTAPEKMLPSQPTNCFYIESTKYEPKQNGYLSESEFYEYFWLVILEIYPNKIEIIVDKINSKWAHRDYISQDRSKLFTRNKNKKDLKKDSIDTRKGWYLRKVPKKIATDVIRLVLEVLEIEDYRLFW